MRDLAPRSLTLAEAAASLGVDPATLRQQIERGQFKAEKRAGSWFATPAEVERYRQVSLGQPGRRRTVKEGRS